VPPKRKGFFSDAPRAEDDLARQREVAALLAPRRTVVQDLPADRIRPNPFQARKSFRDLEELADAIRVQGFVSRLRVRPAPGEPGFFQLVYGERRLRAARLAELPVVPCEVAEHSDDELIEIGLAENIQRRDLDPLEEAEAFQMFIDERGYSVRRLAERIGKDKGYVEDRLALLRTPEDVRGMVAERPDSLRAAREIAKVPDPSTRRDLIAGVVEGRLTTQEVRTLVRELVDAPEPPVLALAPTQPTAGRLVARDIRLLRTTLARWESLAAQGEDEQALVRDALEQVLLDAQRLVAALAPEEARQ
jgi:ParB family chromosome partitioning protein